MLFFLSLIGENYTDSRSVLLTDWMDKPDLLPDNFDYLLRGILETPTRIEQPSYNPMVKLYETIILFIRHVNHNLINS